VRERFLTGADVLLSRYGRWLEGRRLGLVSHQAAVDADGTASVSRFLSCRKTRLSCIFGPEHGYFGAGGPGESQADGKHPVLGIPVYSLYGTAARPSREVLRNIDTVVFDMQDIGVRCYTYVSTLRHVLEACAESGREVVVADRPVPLPAMADGPVLCPGFSSFVGMIPSPLVYAMTPGETALWLKKELGLNLKLRVAPMAGYHRDRSRGAAWPPWIPPSPGIRSWESAVCYPATVCFEALSSVDHGRGTNLAFQVFGGEWIRGEAVVEALESLKLPAVRFHFHMYAPRPNENPAGLLSGVRMTVTDTHRFRPVLTAVSIVACLQDIYGIARVWKKKNSRPDFFDKLFGTDAVRLALMDREPALRIAAGWKRDISRFEASRRECLLYKKEPAS